MWNEIAAWQKQLHLRPDLPAKTIALYTRDTRRFAMTASGKVQKFMLREQAIRDLGLEEVAKTRTA